MKISALNFKKLALSFLIIFIAITMIGCSNGSSKAINSLNEELDNVSNIVSSTNSSEISDVSPIMLYNRSKTELDNYKALTNANMSREEEVRQRVLSLNSYIKSCSYENLKLSKSKINSINTLTKDIKKYNQLLKNTKSELKNSVDYIKKNVKKSSSDNEMTETLYISLNNCMNERFVCLCNLYNNLEQVYILVCKDCENCENNIENSFEINDTSMYDNTLSKQDTNQENLKIENEDNNGKTFKKNIDSYLRNDTEEQTNQNNNTNCPNNDCNNHAVNNNIGNYNYPVNYPNRYYSAPINNAFYPANNPYNYGLNYGMYGNGIMGNGMFGYPYNGMTNRYFFNPCRNTDTFYAFNKNIDTYRLNPAAINNGNLNNFAINEIPVNAKAEIIEEKGILNEDKIEEIKENNKKLKPNNVINLSDEVG